MDSNSLIPFIKSTTTMFETMFQLAVQIGEPTVKDPNSACFDVSGIIGFSGDIEGTVILTFPEATALRVSQLMTGEDLTDRPDDLSDAIGELANMVAGGAKAQFDGKQVAITCPSVVIGKDHVVQQQRDMSCVCIPCECDCGNFNIELSVRPASGNATGNTAAASANA
ncbi:MAG: chemotaxis protein CheX [Planctomycetota bacterium]